MLRCTGDNELRKKSNSGSRVISALLALAIALTVGIAAANAVVRSLFPMRYDNIISQSCAEFGVDESLVYAIVHTESGFDAGAQSNVGARGLMQIMPDTFVWLQKSLPAEVPLDESALYDPEVNIRYGVYYLSRLSEFFGGDEMLMVAAYHAGQGSVSRWLDESGLPVGVFGEDDIPSSTTAHYVSKVERAREVYLRLYFE